MKRVSIDIVTSALNEELCIDEFVARVNQVFTEERDYSHRITIIDNGSTDATWSRIVDQSKKFKNVRGIRMSRTFTFDAALTCGIDHATSDYLIIMASDLQDPPDVIHYFLREREKGFDQVVARIIKRAHVPALRRLLSNIFYRVTFWATDGLIPKNVSDYRLMSRRVYENVKLLRENHRFMRGLTAWTGFSTSFVDIERPNRFAGKSKWLGLDLFTVLFNAIRATFAFSVKPLWIVSFFCFVFGAFSFIGLAILIFLFVVNGVPFNGFGSLIGFAVLSFGILMFTLGVISLYLSLMYEETQKRPIYVIASTTHFSIDK